MIFERAPGRGQVMGLVAERGTEQSGGLSMGAFAHRAQYHLQLAIQNFQPPRQGPNQAEAKLIRSLFGPHLGRRFLGGGSIGLYDAGQILGFTRPPPRLRVF